MTWLYSIVFAGLLLSTESETNVKIHEIHESGPPLVTAALSDEIEKFEQTYPLNANGRVSVSNVNGSIVVEAWDRKEVRLEVTKIADSKERLSEVEIKIDSQPDYFSVETDYGNWKRKSNGDRWKHGRLEVEFRLSVPRTALLNEVETVNGSVTVSNFANLTKISAVNGNVSASNLRGTANLSTVNGEVVADFDRLEAGSKISLSTVNGRVSLIIPSDANATLKADSLNGNITNDFGLPVRKGQYVGRDLYGRVGSGDVQIRLNSVNGGLSIGRKNDGKSINPATNLLPQKNKDSEDPDEDNDDIDITVNIDTPKMNKDIDKADKNSQKAAKDMEKEIRRVKPELEKVTRESIIAKAIEQRAEGLNSKEFKEQIKEAVKHRTESFGLLTDANWGGAPAIEKKSGSFPAKGLAKVTVDAKNCGVSVRGWDRPEVRYSVIRISQRNKKDLEVRADAAESEVNIKVTNLDTAAFKDLYNNSVSQTRVEIFVPKKSNLKIVTDGEIRVEGVSGNIELTGQDDAINIRDGDGQLRVASANGRIRVIGFRGEVNADTVNGDVYLEGDFVRMLGQASDGTFVLTLAEDADADIETDSKAFSIEDLPNNKKLSNGNWRFGKGGRKYKFASGSGGVVIRNTDLIKTEF